LFLIAILGQFHKGNALTLFRFPHVFQVHCALVDVSNWDSIGTPFAAAADGIKKITVSPFQILILDFHHSNF